MAELNPLGSEKLQGNEKIKRILDLTYYNSENNASSLSTKSDFISESKNGVYGIIREKDGYYVKRGLSESSLDYIGGMFMKNKNRFSSYAEALKRMEMLKGQENLQEDTRYVLKPNKPIPSEAVPPSPEMDVPAPPSGDEGIPPAPEGVNPDEEAPEMDGENDSYDEGDPLKFPQKLAGKLGKSLRDIEEKLEPKDIKYFINSVLSALPLDKLEDADKEEILSQFEEDEYGEEGMENPEGVPSDETGEDLPAPVPNAEGEMGEEYSGVDELEELINTPFDNEEEDEYLDRRERHKYLPSGDEEELNELEEECDFCGQTNEHAKGCPNAESYGEEELEEKQFDIHNPDLYPSSDEEDLDEEEYNNEAPSKEFDINEISELINQSVKQNLRKYFK